MIEYRITTYHCRNCSKFLFEHDRDVFVDNRRRMIFLYKRSQNLIDVRFAFRCKYCRFTIGTRARNSRAIVQLETRKVDKITTILHEEY